MDYNTKSVSVGSKACCTCKFPKPLTKEYFGVDSKHKTGFKKRCKSCRKKEYEDKREINMARSKKRYDEKKDEILKKNKEYKEKRSEWYKEYHAKYYRENETEIRKRTKNYFENNKEKMLEVCRVYRVKNTVKNRSDRRRYEQIRRSRKVGLEHSLTVQQWLFICSHFDECCAYCGNGEKLAQEHFVPLSFGGEYTHNNIIPACITCNSSKGNKNFFDWYRTKEFYDKERERKILSFLNYKKNTQQLSIL